VPQLLLAISQTYWQQITLKNVFVVG